jgi:hypothetical protein
MAFTALFDACVLYPASIRDVLLSLAVTDLFRARWTEKIQDEWFEAASKARPEIADRLQRTRELMEIAVPDACIAYYENLIGCVDLPDSNDRHVLAAAIVGRADVIVTTNVKHFPTSALAPYQIEAQHPDTFISHVLTLSPPVALSAIKAMRARLKNPPYSPDAFLDLLGRHELPETATILRENVDLI